MFSPAETYQGIIISEMVQVRSRHFGDVALQAEDIECFQNALAAAIDGRAGDALLMLVLPLSVNIGLVLDDVCIWDNEFLQHASVPDRREGRSHGKHD